MYSFCLLNKKV